MVNEISETSRSSLTVAQPIAPAGGELVVNGTRSLTLSGRNNHDHDHQEPFHQITVKNESHANQCYTLFGRKPRISNDPSKEILSTAFSTNALIKKDNVYKFRFSTSYYAICGKLGLRPQPNSPIRVTDSIPVKLTDLDTRTEGQVLKLVMDGGTPLLVPASSTVLGVPREGFSVITGTDFNFPSNDGIFIGIGAEVRPSPSEEVLTGTAEKQISPIAIFEPEPNHYFNIIPSDKWCVSGLNLLPTTGAIMDSDLFTYGEFSTEVDCAEGEKDIWLHHLRNGKLVEMEPADSSFLPLAGSSSFRRLRHF
ncbi:hypothetical protein TWF481_012073 [Arthrobotrys musiformis]|uniref:Peptidase A1 domain-containing protein n=1 Tax=Arthrobotrys musiformis TaxID=47236 RepID=A0AAV9VVZ0_9PEZI